MPLYKGPHMKNIRPGTSSEAMQFGDSEELIPICQICHKQWHTTDACWYRYGDTPLLRNFSKSKITRPKTAYVANFELFFSCHSLFKASYEDRYLIYPDFYVSLYSPEAFTVLKAYVANFENSDDEG